MVNHTNEVSVIVPLKEKRSDDAKKTKFVKLWDWLPYPRKNKTKNVLLLKITLLMQCWRAYEQCYAPITPNKSP